MFTLFWPWNPSETVLERLHSRNEIIQKNRKIPFLVILASVTPPKGTNYQNVITWTRATWSQRWLKSETCRQTKIWFSSTDQLLAKSLLRKTRTEGQFLTRHGLGGFKGTLG
jgi:hypothetical protein